MKHILFSSLIVLAATQSKAQLVINEVSQGTSGNKEYIELVVKGTRGCGDTSADLRNWIIDDNGGWFGSSAISQGCYRLANVASWSNVPYGSIILIYNDGDKNGLITQLDDPTDSDNDGVYIVPVTSAVIELNASSPNSGSGSSFSYPSSSFSTSTSWTPMALNNNGDAISVVNPTTLNTAYHSMTYGNLSGGTVHVAGSGGQKVYYVSGSQYNSSAGWVSGSAPSNETPGAPNGTANATWINSMRTGGGNGPSNDTTSKNICQGESFVFNGNTYTNTGYYTFTFPKPGGCDSTVTLKLTVNPVPPAPVVTSPLVFCQQDIPTALTATGQNLLWYTAFTGGSGTAIAPIPVTATTGITKYYVTQTISGCESKPRTELIVKVKPKPAPPVVSTPIVYCQRAATVPLTATGQNLLWYTAAIGGFPSTTPPVPNSNISGAFTWYVTQTDSACESDRSAISVVVNEIVAAFTTNKDTVCAVDTLRLTSNATGAGLTYSWNFGDGTIDNTSAPIHIYQQAGTYTITLIVTNNTGCTDSVKKPVLVLPLPTLSFAPDRHTYCQGEATHITSNVSPYYQSIVWNFGDGYEVDGETTPQHSYDSSGTFIINVVTTNKGCPDRSFSDTILVHPLPQVNIGHDTTLCPGNAPLPLVNVAPQLSAVSYKWSTGETTPGILVHTPDRYWLELNNGQCSNTDSLEIFKSCYIDIPNSFSPNGDGLNDYFFPRQFLTRQLTEFDMQIFNRWGEKIFETKTLDGRGWDGDFNGKGQPQGVYIYMITAGFANGVREKYQGNVTLIR